MQLLRWLGQEMPELGESEPGQICLREVLTSGLRAEFSDE